MGFTRAVKLSAKLRMMIAGPSGSGKTFTALRIAKGMAQGKPIAVIDTEHGSASKYADLFEFDVVNMEPPFSPDRMIALIGEAQRAGYAVLVLDSTSHVWEGTGGVLDIVDEAAKRSKSGNTYTAWKEGTPAQNRFVDAIVQSNLHVIATARSKTDYVLVDDRGRQVPKKVGMAPVQRAGFEYEFDIVLEMDAEHNGVITKSRAVALADAVYKKPGEDVAAQLVDWLQGAPAPERKPEPPAAPAPNGNGQGNGERVAVSAKTLKHLHALGTELYGNEWDSKRPALVQWASSKRVASSKELTETEAGYLVKKLTERKAAMQPAPEPPAADEDVDFGMGGEQPDLIRVPTGGAAYQS